MTMFKFLFFTLPVALAGAIIVVIRNRRNRNRITGYTNLYGDYHEF